MFYKSISKLDKWWFFQSALDI